jgi:hypothetical protein
MRLGVQIVGRSNAFVNILLMFEAVRPRAGAACNPVASRLHLIGYSLCVADGQEYPGSLDEHP